jgi:phospholipid/cholesterol/gamma-HCH transport system ATP-binding protein
MPGKIECKEVAFAYGTMPILRSIDLTVARGEIVLVGGKSGHGMSTLLELCVGLLQPKAGTVSWDERDIATLTREELLHARQSIGYMFQTGALISNFTVFDNIALPLRSRERISDEEINDRVRSEMESLMLVNIDSRYPEALSVFQSKAAGLARALIGDPTMLLLDDPIGGIDQGTAQGLLNVIEDRWKKKSMGIIMISHDIDLWRHLPVRRLALESGRLSLLPAAWSGEPKRTGPVV